MHRAIELSVSKDNIEEWIREKMEQFHMIQPNETIILDLPPTIGAKIVTMVEVSRLDGA